MYLSYFMTDEERNKIYAAYGKAVMWHNNAEFILEQFLAFELSKIKNTNPVVELVDLRKRGPEFGGKMKIFREDLLSSKSDVRVQSIYDAFDKVSENRNYLAHVSTGEAGTLDATKVFQPTGFVLMEWRKKDGTVVPQQPLTEKLLSDITETAAMPILLIQEYWVPAEYRTVTPTVPPEKA